MAGLLRGVRPIGFWVIWTTLSNSSIPFISLNNPGLSLELYIVLASFLYNISLIKELFPEPDTPVIQTKLPSGILTLIFFKLFSLAPFISIYLPVNFLLVFGTSIFNLPVKYLPVKLFSFFITSSGVPQATRCPPFSPASGPISIR